MSLTFPREPVVEFFLDRWRDVSGDVRQKPAISITHGRKDWSTKPSPSLCKFTLDDGPEHGDGDYDPNNPLGTWFDYLSRNTPVRVGLRYGRDDFGRTVGSGWGTSPDMGAWSSFQSAGTVASDVTAGTGRHLITSTTAFIAHYLGDVNAETVEVYDEWTVGAINVTGAALEPANLLLRGQGSGSDYYMLRAELTTAEVIDLRIMTGSGSTMIGPTAVMAYPGSASTVGIRFQADGDTLRAKVWRTDQGEPLGWNLEYSLDPDIDVMLGAGWVGVRDGVASGNSNTKPVVFSHDNFEVRVPRFVGETAKMVPLTSIDHTDQRTTVECAGIRRRLAKGEKVLRSALYRYVTRGGTPFAVADFWALDEELDSTARGTNAFGGPPMKFIPSTGGAIKWGTPTGLLPITRAVTLVPGGPSSNGQMFAPMTPGNFTGAAGYGVLWMQRLGSDSQASIILDLDNSTQLFLTFEQGIATLTWLPSLTVLMANVPVPETGDDNVWHTMALGCRQSGGNILFDLMIDDNAYEVSQAGTAGLPENVIFSAFPGEGFTYEVGSVLTIKNGIFTGSSGWHAAVARDAYLGHPMEHAGDRFARLCAEEGVPTSLIGAPSSTPAMGPQRPLPLLTLTQECLDVDQGSGFDPRAAAGFGMRTHRATTGQDPVLTLQYVGQVAPEFGATTDDQGTVNDVTAKRPLGGSYRIEQATGAVNTADPGTNPQAAGRYDITVSPDPNVATDLNLPDQAGWRVHMGTVEGPRYPTVTVNLAADDVVADPDLVSAVLDVHVDDAITVTGAQVRRIYDDVRLCVRGYTETVDTQYQHKLVFNCTPYEPLDVAVYGAASDRYDTAGSALASGITSSATSFTVNVTAGELWTTSAAQFPLDIWIGGERIRLSAISGASSPQTFTVAGSGRAVNGVAKAHSAGAAVRIFKPVYYGH